MFRLDSYRNLGPDAFVSRLIANPGVPIGAITQCPGQQPHVAIEAERSRSRFLNWALPRAGRPTASDDDLLVAAANMLRTWLHLDHAPGICYRLAGDPDPWISGTVRTLPKVIHPSQARIHLAQHFPHDIPQTWDADQHRFIPVPIPEGLTIAAAS